MAVIIDGKIHAAALKEKVREKISRLPVPPSLSVVLAGNDPASLVYIKGKEKACEEAGIRFAFHHLRENIGLDELLCFIDTLNKDKNVNGIMVQNSLPRHLDRNTVFSGINPLKDVDCLHPQNIGLSMTGQGWVRPCTPAGIMALLKNEGIELEGRHCVVVGRSEIVGKPLSYMLLQQNATVTICHSYTRDLAEHCRGADILVAAAGKIDLITADMIKPGCVLIDVGINRREGKKICGDVDYKACFNKAGYITPVPGGVGPMTVAVLMENCVRVWERQHE